jgi:replicative DNA helicase
MYQERLPPHDVDSEEAVIGSLLIDSDSAYKVAAMLKPDDFYREKNRSCYEACLGLYHRGEGINQVTVAQELSRLEKLEAVGGSAYLNHLLAAVPTSVHIEYYGGIVHRLAVMRNLISAAGQIAGIGYDAGPDLDESLDKAEDILYRLRSGQPSAELVHIRQLLDRYFEETGPSLEGATARLPEIPTGFAKLDDFLGGLQRSDLVILGARPSHGKTSLALNIARNCAIAHHAHVAIFSLEMSRSALVQRFLSSEARLDSRRLRLGELSDEDERVLMDATGILSETSIYVDDSPQIGIAEIRSKARRLHHEQGLDLIIVDYLQLIQGDGKRGENRVQEISEISRALKGVARELSVPVLAVSQLSRAVESRTSRRPQLSDLRESGSIEQDADVVLFIHREEMYYPTEDDWKKQHLDEPFPKGIANVIIAKHRNGPIGELDLRFVSWLAKFEDLPQVEAEEL